MKAHRYARILSAVQTMRSIALTDAQRVSAEIADLKRMRVEIISSISGEQIFGHLFVAQMEKKLTKLAGQLQSLLNEKENVLQKCTRLAEQERIAQERLKSARMDELRRREERDCLDWVSR